MEFQTVRVHLPQMGKVRPVQHLSGGHLVCVRRRKGPRWKVHRYHSVTATATTAITYFSATYHINKTCEGIPALEKKRYSEYKKWYQTYHRKAEELRMEKERNKAEKISESKPVPHESLPQPLAMIEDFNENIKRQNVVKKTTPQASTESGSSRLKETPRNMWEEPTLQPYQHTTAVKEDNKPRMNMDSPEMDPPNVTEYRMQEPETLPTPETPLNYGAVWQEVWQEAKSTVLWLLLLSQVAMLSYALGRRHGARPKPNRSRQKQDDNMFELRRRNMQGVSPDQDGFEAVDLRGYEEAYESVNSLPPPPVERQTTSM